MEITKVCKSCGQVFEHGISASHLRQKHDLTVAQYEQQYGKIIFKWSTGSLVLCRYCNKTLDMPLWRRNGNKKGFICSECWGNPITVNCFSCGKIFTVSRKEYNIWTKAHNNFYCSSGCRSENVGQFISKSKKEHGSEISEKLKANWADPVLRKKRLDGMIPAAFKRRKRTIVTCSNCGIQIEKCNCFIRANSTGNFYCSVKCQYEDPKFYRANMLAAQRLPTRPEQLLIDLIKDNGLPYRYTGDGEEHVGVKIPDFVHETDKVAVDIFGDYFHSKVFLEKKGVEYDPKGQKRIDYFKQNGYELIVIWEREFNDPNWKQIISDKLKR
jgi:G:T-mismatch repair DNA endonuclease (very short patch repair protein)